MRKPAEETIIEASKNGTLAMLLEKHRIKNLAVFFLRENPYTALRRWAITDAQYERLNAVYEDLGLGELKDYMRAIVIPKAPAPITSARDVDTASSIRTC